MLLLHPPIEPWAVAGPDGLDLVLLCDSRLAPGRVFVRSLPDNEELLTAMQPDGRAGQLQRWRARIAWDGGHGLQRYAFVAAEAGQHGADGRLHWLGADGPHRHVPPEAQHFRMHRHGQPPAWVREQVFYQVFPDRFARGSTAPVTAARGVVMPWGAPPPVRHGGHAFYGGDLPGLTQRLPYLQDELGVSALYLNPVFASPSNHRYDTSDYTRVDAALGGDAALVELRTATHERGMRLVLDAVVNHTGAEHPWLADAPGHYARDDSGRPLGWKGNASLPVLDFAVPAVQQAVYSGPDAVLRHWLRAPYGIDGWRMDVVHMLGEGPGARHNARHVRAIRRAMLDENPEAYLLGEHFSEATRWLQGDQEDGAMNYFGFTTPLRGWLAGLAVAGVRQRLDTAAFAAWLISALAAIPYANQLAQLNLLDSHDTPRLLTELDGDLQRLHIAATLLFTWPGVPCIYYGDEIGLAGGPDPDCRRCFDWDRSRWQHGLWAHFRHLAETRRARAEWRHGALRMLAQGEHWLAFARFTEQAASIVFANRGPAVQVQISLAALPLETLPAQRLGGQAVAAAAGVFTLCLPACSAEVVLLG